LSQSDTTNPLASEEASFGDEVAQCLTPRHTRPLDLLSILGIDLLFIALSIQVFNMHHILETSFLDSRHGASTETPYQPPCEQN
jgi:hypothetical protein